MQERVCAIIVTWNSNQEIIQNIEVVANQVAEVVVVDNGSSPENLTSLKKITSLFNNVSIIENKENMGIAHATNRGAQYAFDRGYEWILTLDDNGKPDPTMVAALFTAYHNLSLEQQSQTAIVAPNYNTMKGLVYSGTTPFVVTTTIASGQLVKTAIWKEVGPYKEDFFIACVDHEFCFRVLAHGYQTVVVPTAVLRATAGPKPILRSIFGRKFVVPNYRPDRYYYTYRNMAYLWTHYLWYAPRWFAWNAFSSAATVGKIIFFEDQKWQKLWLITHGILDGLHNKLGKLN